MKKYLVKNIKTFIKFFENNNNKKLNSAFKGLLENDRIILLDIGAAGDIQPRWKKISKFLNYIGFEPDIRSYELLKQQTNTCSDFRIINSAVWDTEGDLSINFCNKPMVSSHYYPNYDFLKRFSENERFEIVSKVSIQTKRLDDQDIQEIDFVKLDIQGGELAALKGGSSLLEDCLGVEVEVSFISQYIGQPLFGEICSFLSERGFEFIDFVHLNRWERKSFNDFGQLVWGDALFLKSPETILKKYNTNSRKIKKYLAICSLYKRFDFIDILEEKTISNPKLSQSLSLIRKRHYLQRNRFIMLNKILKFMKSELDSYILH
jgi:FkbM family methyltransferase